MQYVGEKRNIRVKVVGSYNLENGRDIFLLDKGLMMEFLLDTKYSMKGTHVYSSKNGLWNAEYESLTQEQKDNHGVIVKPKSQIEKCESFEYKDTEYLREIRDDGRVYIFKILPQLFDDETFRWKYNKKYRTNETLITLGVFEFLCIADSNNDVDIDVRYAKCDNRHRNKVTLTTIRVLDADNTSILEAIEYWRKQFVEELGKMA